MKATIRTFSLCLFLIGTALTASAQLKVANGGTIYMRGDSVYGRTNVSIGHKTDSMTNIGNSHFTGLRSLLYNDLSTGHAIGVYGEARQSVPNILMTVKNVHQNNGSKSDENRKKNNP